MSELTERLRYYAERMFCEPHMADAALYEAADRIEELEARVEGLKRQMIYVARVSK